jgi:hypothetical protein
MVKFSWMLVMCFALMCPTASFASDRTHEGDRLPEPMLVESTTDIDSDESGEVEVDVLGGRGVHGVGGSAEVE